MWYNFQLKSYKAISKNPSMSLRIRLHVPLMRLVSEYPPETVTSLLGHPP